MRVFLDLNHLGKSYLADIGRTGIFRATEGVTRALLRRADLSVSCGAEASWVDDLLLRSYAERRGTELGPHIVQTWQLPGMEAEARGLIERILAAEARGGDAPKDRAALTLLNATARRTPPAEPYDVVHSLRGALPAPGRVSARARALTIHDLIPLRHPEWMYAEAGAELAVIRASLDLTRDFVIANSEATAGDVVTLFGMARERVFVTPFAAEPELFHPEPDAERIRAVRARYGIPEGDYLLSLCTLEPRKNLALLIQCYFALLRQEKLELNLVLVGARGWKTEAFFGLLATAPELARRVVLTGYVADADLAALYSGARLFAYPSLYEGFGLPVLEAMQCGTPVITSTAASLPEVAGSAAVCVSPTDGDALSAALLGVLNDPEWAAELRRRGLARAATFTWDATAERTVSAYRSMLAAG